VLGRYEGSREQAARKEKRTTGFDLGAGKTFKSKRDPSSRKALLWMTAKYGLADWTGI
jgi:hypothetical protein